VRIYSFSRVIRYNRLNAFNDDANTRPSRAYVKISIRHFRYIDHASFIRGGIIFGYLEITEHICTVQCTR